jgi:hypothetical protein
MIQSENWILLFKLNTLNNKKNMSRWKNIDQKNFISIFHKCTTFLINFNYLIKLKRKKGNPKSIKGF